MARRRFFVSEVRADQAQISGEEAHHLTRVLRVQPGQKFEISDNHHLYLAEVKTVAKDGVEFAIIERLEAVPPAVRIALLASLIRFERFEWLLEKATELGVESITPIQAERSEKGLDRAAEKRMARWRKIVREASEQSRRVRLPEVNAAAQLNAALAVTADHRFALDEAAHARAINSALPQARGKQDRVALMVGPEGGWTDRERAAMAGHGWTPVGLGGTILRSETAAIAAIAIIAVGWQPLS